MIVKAGANINILLTYPNSSYGLSADGYIYYNVSPLPQIGLLFEIGGGYTLKNNNLLSLSFVANVNFINTVKVNYELYPKIPERFSEGSMQATGSYAGIKVGYIVTGK